LGVLPDLVVDFAVYAVLLVGGLAAYWLILKVLSFFEKIFRYIISGREILS